MALTKAQRSAAAMKAARTRKRNAAKKPVVRRKRRVMKKKGMLSDIISQTQAENSFKQLVGIGVGYYAGEKITPFVDGGGEKPKQAVAFKLIGGFLISSIGKMPNVGAGMMSSGFKTLFTDGGLGDNGAKRANYLNDMPEVMATDVYLNDSDYLNDNGYLNESMDNYTAAYQSNNY